MIMSPARRHLFVLALLLIVHPHLEGQEPVGSTQFDTTALAFEREVFTYPVYERRNPFKTLLAGDGGGPRFERLLLLGIIYSDDPTQSLALFAEGTRTVTPAQAGVPETVTVEVTGGTYQVRNGESVGNVTVIRIDRQQVAIEVEEFGIRESRVIALRRNTAGQGGP